MIATGDGESGCNWLWDPEVTLTKLREQREQLLATTPHVVAALSREPVAFVVFEQVGLMLGDVRAELSRFLAARRERDEAQLFAASLLLCFMDPVAVDVLLDLVANAAPGHAAPAAVFLAQRGVPAVPDAVATRLRVLPLSEASLVGTFLNAIEQCGGVLPSDVASRWTADSIPAAVRREVLEHLARSSP